MFLKVPTFRLNFQPSFRFLIVTLRYAVKVQRNLSSEFWAIITSKFLKNHIRPSGICFPNRKIQYRKIRLVAPFTQSHAKIVIRVISGKRNARFSTRLKEHQKAVEHKHSYNSALAEHCLRSGHTVSWEAAKILRTSANWRRDRRILEAWESNTCRNPLNRDDGMHLPHEFLNLALRDRT